MILTKRRSARHPILLSFVQESNFIGGDIHNFLTKKLYIALGVALISAEIKGINAIPMEGFGRVKLNRLLNLQEKELKSVLLLSIGYSSDDHNKKYPSQGLISMKLYHL